MLEATFRVIHVGNLEELPSRKEEGKTTFRRTIVLQQIGSYAPQGGEAVRGGFVARLFGQSAQCDWYPGERLIASLDFSANLYEGKWYQDIAIRDVVKIKV